MLLNIIHKGENIMKLHFRVIILISIAAILVLSTIFFHKSDEKKYNKSNENTYNLLLNSEGMDGGYSIFNNEIPISLYSSYYNINLLINNGYDIPNKKSLYNTLSNIKFENIKNKNIIDIENLYFQVGLCNELKINISEKYKTNIKNSINELVNSNGMFVLANDNNLLDNLIVTNLCTTILDNLKISYDYTRLNETITKLYEDNTVLNISKYKWSVLDTTNKIQTRINKHTFFDTTKGLALKKYIMEEGKSVFSGTVSNSFELFNDISLYSLLNNLGIKINPSAQFLNSVNQMKLSHGGFNLLRTDIEDPKFTLEVLPIYSTNNKPDITLYINLIKKYQQLNGMFSPATPIKSLMIKSYMALKLFKDINKPVPNRLVKYFEDSKLEGLSSNDRYYLIQARKILNITEKDTNSITKQIHIKDINDLYNILNYIELNKLSDNDKKQLLQSISAMQNNDGAYGFNKRSNLQDTFYTLEILKKCNSVNISPSLKNWVYEQIINYNSFSDEKDLNFINLFYAMSIMDILKLSPSNVNDIQNYVDNHKLKIGGFSFFKNSNISSLQATYYGYECERLLKKF